MTENKIKSKTYFDSTAENYDETMDGRYVKPMYEGLVSEIKKHTEGKLLDVGCGTGNVLKMLKDTDLQLNGVDLSAQMINQAKKQLSCNVVLKQCDAERILFEEEEFDIIVCNASFHHYPHPEAVLREMRRVAKEGATLYIGEGYVLQPVRFFLDIYFKFSKAGDYKSYGKRQLTKIINNNGFRLTEIKELGSQKLLYIAKAI